MASLIALNVPLMAPLIAQLILPNLASSPVISLHPLAVIGFVTFLVNALQLLPIGRLDGGRVATAVLGGGQAGFVSGLTLTLLGFSTLFGGDNPILLFWGVGRIRAIYRYSETRALRRPHTRLHPDDEL